MSQKLFGTDGVRGIANTEPITVGSALRLAQAAVRVLAKEESCPTVLVGRDTRASGEMLESAISAGLASLGVHVLLAGIIPTPAAAYLTARYGASFGIMISASHNPFQDNGIKLFGATGYKLADESERAIEAEYFHPGNRQLPIGRSIGRIRRIQEATEDYVTFAASTVPKDFSLSGVKIAVDMANGAAYQTTPMALTMLGAAVDMRFGAPDGFNINVDCGSTHPTTLSRLVRESGAAFGIAHDGDADRLLLCDELGFALDGDDLLAIAATDLLGRDQLNKNTVVSTIMSNFGLDHVVQRHGGKVVRTEVGDRFVMDALVQRQLNLGGEQSGHIIFRDFTTTGDGLVAALQIIAIMLRTGKPLSELRQILKKFPQVLCNVVVKEKKPFEQFDLLTVRLREAESRLDGKGRVLLRYSGTELKARLLLEGQDADELHQLAEAIVEQLVKNLGP
ncbi:MAG: phosphoglucosamine mutase [Verrucomicrobia bacterium]|nr:phosphoglucosamine mutase [Verrucomicrobiota bacterium]